MIMTIVMRIKIIIIKITIMMIMLRTKKIQKIKLMNMVMMIKIMIMANDSTNKDNDRNIISNKYNKGKGSIKEDGDEHNNENDSTDSDITDDGDEHKMIILKDTLLKTMVTNSIMMVTVTTKIITSTEIMNAGMLTKSMTKMIAMVKEKITVKKQRPQ